MALQSAGHNHMSKHFEHKHKDMASCHSLDMPLYDQPSGRERLEWVGSDLSARQRQKPVSLQSGN